MCGLFFIPCKLLQHVFIYSWPAFRECRYLFLKLKTITAILFYPENKSANSLKIIQFLECGIRTEHPPPQPLPLFLISRQRSVTSQEKRKALRGEVGKQTLRKWDFKIAPVADAHLISVPFMKIRHGLCQDVWVHSQLFFSCLPALPSLRSVVLVTPLKWAPCTLLYNFSLQSTLEIYLFNCLYPALIWSDVCSLWSCCLF